MKPVVTGKPFEIQESVGVAVRVDLTESTNKLAQVLAQESLANLTQKLTSTIFGGAPGIQ